MNEQVFSKYDIMSVGEMSSTSIDNCIKYTNPNQEELNMTFSFHHLKVDYPHGDKWTKTDFDFQSLKKILSDWQVEMNQGGGWNALFWCNHDQPRVVTRFGDDEKYHKESAKMLATALHMMQGTPYIYQGEEFGMTNPKFDSIEDYRDVESLNIFNIKKQEGLDEQEIIEILKQKSRDNSRTPVQWNSSKYAGFTTGTPWIQTAANYKEINAETSLNDTNSIFYHYQKLIQFRKDYDVITNGDYQLISDGDEKVFSYIRTSGAEKLLIINNFYGKEHVFVLPSHLILDDYDSKMLISNYEGSAPIGQEIPLRPYESIVYHLKK
jgi:trehalose-6-phosphate hydrolase